REARAAVPEQMQAVDQMTGRELLQALDEELARLPARYREPLVLCYLEGLTRDQAAARLGVPAATLRSQVERGRLKLGDALARRVKAGGRPGAPRGGPRRRPLAPGAPPPGGGAPAAPGASDPGRGDGETLRRRGRSGAGGDRVRNRETSAARRAVGARGRVLG